MSGSQIDQDLPNLEALLEAPCSLASHSGWGTLQVMNPIPDNILSILVLNPQFVTEFNYSPQI